MLSHLADVSIRSFLLALPAIMVLWMLRSRRTAALQHAVWTAVVCGMLALFAFGEALPRLPLRILERPAAFLPAAATVAPAIADAIPTVVQPFTPAPVRPRRAIGWSSVALLVYGAVAFGLLAQFATGMFFVRKLLANSIPCAVAGNLYESDRIAVPFTVGWLRPRILLPSSWREWDREKLDAVLAHEGAHVRRRDTLVAMLAAINRCVFWFHPLAWMLERKLALLAELACDESCVAAIGDRHRYAHLLLEMALVVDGAQGRLHRHALTMAAGSHIRRRIDSLLQEGRTFSRGLTWVGWTAVVMCGVPLLWGAAAVELDRQASPPPARVAQDRPASPAHAPAVAMAAPQSQAPAAVPPPPAPATPKFDAATVKPCQPGDGANHSGRGGGQGRGFGTDPGRLWVNCMTVSELIDSYLQMGNEKRMLNDSGGLFDTKRVRGGPAWIHSDRYSIEAETSDPEANGPTGGATPATKLLRGSMLRALMEDRFQLKTHHETEEVPMYAMTVAKSGFKLKPMAEGGCRPHDPTKGTRVNEMFPPGETPLCVQWTHFDGPNWAIDAAGQQLSNFAGALSGIMDRHVLDKTGVTGVYSYRVVFARDDTTPGNFPPDMPSPFPVSDLPPAASIFAVLEQQLGLKLVADKGPREYLVIDHVARPSEN